MSSGHCSKGVQSLLLLPCAAGTLCGMEKPGALPWIPAFPVPAPAVTGSFPEDSLEMENACRVEMFSVPAPCSSPRSALSFSVGAFQDLTCLGIFSLVQKGEGRCFTPAVLATGTHLISRKEAFPSFISADSRGFPCVGARALLLKSTFFSVCPQLWTQGMGGKGS